MSHRAALALGRILGRIGCVFAAGERGKALRHLELAYGDELAEADRKAIARQVFEGLAMNLIEGLHSLSWTEEDYLRILKTEGAENFSEALEGGRGVILVSGHLGSWEILPPYVAYSTGQKLGIVMRDMSDPVMNARLKEFRSRAGNTIYSTTDSPLGMIRRIKKNGVMSMMADQDSRHVRGVHVDFFGRPALTPIGPAHLARKLNTPIVPVGAHRLRDKPTRHALAYFPPIYPDLELDEDEDIQRITQAFTNVLESQIRKYPGQWAWMHERWKHRKAKKKARRTRRQTESV